MSLQRQLKALHGQVACALEELTCITTHDGNLERQYKEGQTHRLHSGTSDLYTALLIAVVEENRKLNAELDRARNELRVRKQHH